MWQYAVVWVHSFHRCTAGALYTVEWVLNFHIGFIGKHNTRRKLVMDGSAIARFYVTRGHFAIDFLTVLVWIAQVGLQP